jgi:hypothetical protein
MGCVGGEDSIVVELSQAAGTSCQQSCGACRVQHPDAVAQFSHAAAKTAVAFVCRPAVYMH